MNAPAIDANDVIKTSKNVFLSHGARSGDECLHSCDDNRAADQNDEVFNAHRNIRATLLQKEQSAAPAHAAKLLLKISRPDLKHRAVKDLQYLKTLALHPETTLNHQVMSKS